MTSKRGPEEPTNGHGIPFYGIITQTIMYIVQTEEGNGSFISLGGLDMLLT
jgi:hypothetical protein